MTLKIGSVGITLEAIDEGDTGPAVFDDKRYKVKAVSDVRKYKEVIVVDEYDGVIEYQKAKASEYKRRYTISTDKDRHFTGSIAQNAVTTENISGLESNKITITKITIQAKENLDFDVMFFGNRKFQMIDLDEDSFQAFERLDIPTNGIRIGSANQYYLDLANLGLDYEDEDEEKELHVALRCRTAAGKSSGTAGEVKLSFIYIPKE